MFNKDFIHHFFSNRAKIVLDSSKIRRGFMLILKSQGIPFYLKMVWELITIVIYVPAGNIFATTLKYVNNKWDKFTKDEQECVLAALYYLDKKGDITAILKPVLDRISFDNSKDIANN